MSWSGDSTPFLRVTTSRWIHGNRSSATGSVSTSRRSARDPRRSCYSTVTANGRTATAPQPLAAATIGSRAGIEAKESKVATRAIDVSSVDLNLLDATVRLVRLLENPKDYQVLAPLIKKEIIYRLLTGGQGVRLAHLLVSSGETHRIAKAVGHLRDHFDEPLKIESIANQLGMSVSGFHHHFKSLTSMSPLQYQKQIRLQEARRLMLGEDLDAASAGFRVGYEDPAYFSRDYKKLFGAPPQRDITKLRSNLENRE